MVPYNAGIMWTPPCDMCHGPPMYPPPILNQGMKRAASNLSMNISSASSDVTGYPWQPHMHHHMPHMYPGYYPTPSPHMIPSSIQSSSISIPDSMAAFSKVSSSPAPSVRSSSRRSSQKANKSRSFSTADLSRRTRSTHRSDSDETTTSSPSFEEEIKPSFSSSSSLPWQCDHCTFINQAGSRVCGMCSKPQGFTNQRSHRRSSDKRRTDRRYLSRRRDVEDEDDRDPSDYDNDAKHQQNFNSKDLRRGDRSSKSSTTSRSKKKLRRRGGSSGSASDVVEELERQLSDMKVSSRGVRDYDGESSKLRERASKRREGKHLRR